MKKTNPVNNLKEKKQDPDAQNDRVRVHVRGDRGKKLSRTDQRSERTVEDILDATFRVLVDKGASKLSVRAVCNEAGISRGTLYRYYASKEELIVAAAGYLRDQTDRAVNAAVDGIDDPQERFAAFLKYTLANFETEGSSQLAAGASKLLETEPTFLLNYFGDNFAYFKNRVTEAMNPVYDSWDKSLGVDLDRNLISEMFVRFALSETLVPTEGRGADLPNRLNRLIKQVLGN